jgi:membrane-bound lytic murein transglycosylase B
MPENWLRSVIAVESNGDPKAVSSKGAMGLMQLMPETWKNLRAAYDLGADPFDPKANILAGTAYLKAMHDRFGYPALFAAYNVGEACYEEHLRTGNPLPEETLAYVADLGKRLGFDPEVLMKVGSRDGLFFRLSSVGSSGGNAENSVPANGLFVRISTGKAVER